MGASRSLFVLAMAALLSACGPSQGDIETALRTHYSTESEIGVDTDLADIQDGALADFEGCQRRDGSYECEVSFQTAGGIVAAKVWMKRESGRWAVENIVPGEEIG